MAEPMFLAPRNLFRPLAVGAAVVVSAALPVAILFALSIHCMLEEQFAGFGVADATSGSFKTSFLAVQMFGASLQPWILFGIALSFFAIGPFSPPS